MNVIIEILNEKNKIRNSNIWNMNKNIDYNDFVIDDLNFDTIICDMSILYENEYTVL